MGIKIFQNFALVIFITSVYKSCFFNLEIKNQLDKKKLHAEGLYSNHRHIFLKFSTQTLEMGYENIDSH